MSEPVKVLYFVDRMLRGGIQSLVIDWVSRFNKDKIHVDFLLLDDGNEYELENTLKDLGCNVYKLKGIWIRIPLDFIKEDRALKNFFKEHHDYKVVHLHSTSKNYMVLKYAKKYGIPIRISHAHALDFQSDSRIKKIIGNMLKPKLIKYTTDFFACSKEAGEWLFGKKIVDSGKLQVIKNAVDYDKFKYNEQNKKEIREKYEIKDNEILIGHVGRFTEVKNHIFMINLLNELLKEDKRYKMMFVGEGILEDDIMNKTKELGIQNNVIFAGFQNEVYKYLSAFDIFILPSIYEGLGLALIEAQANGLPCIATKGTIPKEVNLSSNLNFAELKLSDWVKEIKNKNITRGNNYENLKEKGYIVNETIDYLEKQYLNNN